MTDDRIPKFTPGPWRISVDGRGFASIRTGERDCHMDSDLVAEVFGIDGNADLIAAAPKLFAALEAMLANYGPPLDSIEYPDSHPISAARAALSMARGGI